jgi:MFS superfamily sulfate permease-like transporter
MANSGVASVTHRFLPILDWAPGYRRDWLMPDVLAGLALWAVMVPEGMAYAGIVGVPPIMGLYTIVPAFSPTRCSARRASSLSDPTRRPV